MHKYREMVKPSDFKWSCNHGHLWSVFWCTVFTRHTWNYKMLRENINMSTFLSWDGSPLQEVPTLHDTYTFIVALMISSHFRQRFSNLNLQSWQHPCRQGKHMTQIDARQQTQHRHGSESKNDPKILLMLITVTFSVT